VPVAFRQGARQVGLTEKRRGSLWIILSGILALLVLGLAAGLAYLAWTASSEITPESSDLNSNSPPNNTSANPSKATEAKLPEVTNSEWLEGIWEGEGYQSDTKTTWAVRLTVHDDIYAIEYPNIPCRGRWTLIDKRRDGASFTEVITQGTDLCGNNSHVLIERTNDSEMSCKYTHPSIRVVIATATLSRKAKANAQP
jgi:hypothetical protein